MSFSHRVTLALALSFSLTGCDGDGAGPEGLDERFVGSWVGTSFVFTPVGTGDPVELIAEGGSVTITFSANGRFSTTTMLPGEAAETDPGTVTITGGSTLRFDFDDPDVDTLDGSFQFSDGEDTLTLDFEDTQFDFDGDGTDDPARLRVVLTRQ